jgi:hypothetical protein
VYSTYVDEDERAAGGSTILVRDKFYIVITGNVISIKLTFRPRQFHWMNEAIMGVGSGKSFSSVENPSAVLPLEIYSEISFLKNKKNQQPKAQNRSLSQRQSKAEKDPVQVHNRYGRLDDAEEESEAFLPLRTLPPSSLWRSTRRSPRF